MKLNIVQIKQLLNEHNYLTDKTIKISDVKTGRKYNFTCHMGHTFDSLLNNTFQSGQFSCPICSGRRVLRGFNDLWTTNPEIAKMLKNPEDGYKYTSNSNVKLEWECADCGYCFELSPNKMTKRINMCTVCGDGESYPEKFLSSLLNQFCIYFKKEKLFDWSDNKRYDFYLPEYSCIIETHGKQHYTTSDFSYLSGKTYLEEQYNDEDKMFYAKEYGKIENYIVLDCRKSELHWIKHSVLESGLLEILEIIPDTIDWDECHEFALSNVTKNVCEAYEQNKNINVLCEMFNLSRNAIRDKLKQGSKFGWCTYDPKEAIANARRERGIKIVQTMSKVVVQMDMDGNSIAEFPSIQEAQRALSVSHIWDCIIGTRHSAGGYRWRYKNEH